MYQEICSGCPCLYHNLSYNGAKCYQRLFDAGIDAISRQAYSVGGEKGSVYKISIAFICMQVIIAFCVVRIPFLSLSSTHFFYSSIFSEKFLLHLLSSRFISVQGPTYGKRDRCNFGLFFLSVLAALAREIIKTIEDNDGIKR
jgi:hypothetical protein